MSNASLETQQAVESHAGRFSECRVVPPFPRPNTLEQVHQQIIVFLNKFRNSGQQAEKQKSAGMPTRQEKIAHDVVGFCPGAEEAVTSAEELEPQLEEMIDHSGGA